MTDDKAYTFVADALAEVPVPENGILSRTIFNDDRIKVVFFGFAAGQELSAHTAPMPATLYFAKGKARVRLGQDWMEAGAGTFVHMPAKLEHAIQTTEPTVMLLTLLKQPVAG
ncbi:MAG: cupin domain-containing protein [Acidobacteria bacterium]|nr:cupin domain-containing protein [Acidobacteriota bacterium]